jgi:phosphoribosylglycinamide formyltransferase 1
MTLNAIVLISGNGSNLQAIIDAIAGGLPVKICAVISSRADVFGLERARQAGIPTYVIRDEAALRAQIDEYSPQLLVLAGFMRRLSADFVEHYAGRVINIHPSLLPKYPGLQTHRRVLAAKEAHHGVTIHYVTAEVDAGPIICQASLPVLKDDNEATLQQRIHHLEHRLYPQILAWIAADRLRLTTSGKVLLDGLPIKSTECGFTNCS